MAKKKEKEPIKLFDVVRPLGPALSKTDIVGRVMKIEKDGTAIIHWKEPRMQKVENGFVQMPLSTFYHIDYLEKI